MPEQVPIRFRRGAVAGIPAAVDGCPLWTTDTHDLYIGQDGANYLIGGASSIAILDSLGALAFEDAAAGVPYDPTASGLVATNVQDAIDEMAGTSGEDVPALFGFGGW